VAIRIVLLHYLTRSLFCEIVKNFDYDLFDAAPNLRIASAIIMPGPHGVSSNVKPDR
jgi:hypothetical protein